MNRSLLRRLMLGAPLSLGLACSALLAQEPAQQPVGVNLGNDIRLNIHGILSASLFLQDSRWGLGNGQQAEFVSEELEGWWHGGDVRNMRLTFDFRGPDVGNGWRANALFEADLFGGFNGAGAFGDEQPIPRLRLAYAELSNGRTTFRVGQGWALTLGNIPVSTSHIGFPLGWGTGGFIGWRFPGVFFFQSLSPNDARTKAQLQFAILKNSWVDEAAADQPSAGEAGTPQFEARLNVDGKAGTNGTWGLYVVGHWDQKDLNNVRAEGAPDPGDNTLDSWAVESGARFASGRLTLHGNAYVGKAMGHHFAHLIQFGDIAGRGGWAQAGVDMTPRWSIWLYGGVEDADEDDISAPNDRVRSVLLVPMVRFKAGPYSTGVELLHSKVDTQNDLGASGDRSGNQIIWSVRYDF